MKKNEQTYIVINNKINNVVIIATSKTQTGRIVGLSYDTIKRHLENSLVYDTTEFTIWTNVPIVRRKNYNRKNNLHI